MTATIRSISFEGSSVNSLGRSASATRALIGLAAAGFVTVDGDQVVLTPKGKKAKKKEEKTELRKQHKEIVFRAVQKVAKNDQGLSLTKPIHFRAAVEAAKVGVESITRTDVLDSLRDLRDEGLVQSVRTSRNNFGVRWKVHPRYA
jgi:predicted ABC-type transport system involved in lysophospholipase L1 biosynthesis ATPase subunit